VESKQGGKTMRSTVKIDNKHLDELVCETKAKNKSAAVTEAIREYLRQKKIIRIMSMKGKLEFKSDLFDSRHYSR
jgi:hypoxanthine-guanine phosphoribosyltransferase